MFRLAIFRKACRVSVVLAIAVFLQAQETNTAQSEAQPESLSQLQSTLQRLQNEVKTLQKTIRGLISREKKSKKENARVAPPLVAPAPVTPAQTATAQVLPQAQRDLVEAATAYSLGRQLEELNLRERLNTRPISEGATPNGRQIHVGRAARDGKDPEGPVTAASVRRLRNLINR